MILKERLAPKKQFVKTFDHRQVLVKNVHWTPSRVAPRVAPVKHMMGSGWKKKCPKVLCFTPPTPPHVLFFSLDHKKSAWFSYCWQVSLIIHFLALSPPQYSIFVANMQRPHWGARAANDHPYLSFWKILDKSKSNDEAVAPHGGGRGKNWWKNKKTWLDSWNCSGTKTELLQLKVFTKIAFYKLKYILAYRSIFKIFFSSKSFLFIRIWTNTCII